MQTSQSPPISAAKVLRMKSVWERLGVGRSSGYALMANDPNFPRRVILGKRARGILESDLDAYILSRVR